MVQKYNLVIEESSRISLKDTPFKFNEISFYFDDLDEVKRFLISRYDYLPQGRNKIYYENINGEDEEIGFTHSFWNRDISHNTKSWFQTDWIYILLMKYILIK